MPDDDWALGQNEVDVRNEARKQRSDDLLRAVGTSGFAASVRSNVYGFNRDRDLADAIEHLRLLNETQAINAHAEQRRQQSITRTLDEIQRLMDG